MNRHKRASQRKGRPALWVRRFAAFAVLCLFAAGCASKNVNPTRARANTGYVDFHATGDPLSWQVERINDGGQASKVFTQYEPITEPVRLAFAPGQYRLRVTFLNHVITEPGLVEVVVRDGMITPVRVTLVQTGTAQVEARQGRAQGTYYGRYGRGTKLRLNEAGMFRITAEAQSPLPYQIKTQMPYAASNQ